MLRVVFFIFIFPFTIAASNFGTGRDSLQSSRKVNFAGVYLNGGMNFCNGVTLSNAQLTSLWPDLTNKKYASYQHPYYGGSNFDGYAVFEIGASFYTNFRKKPVINKKFQTHLGIDYANPSFISTSFENMRSERVDTLYSSSSSALQFRDSVYAERISVSYISNCAGFNLSESYSSNTDKFLSWNAEIGGRVLYSFKQSISEFFVTNRFIQTTSDPNKNYNATSYYDYKDVGRSQYNGNLYSSNKHAAVFFLYGSAGLNLRLCRYKKWNSRIIVSPTINGGLQFTQIQAVGSFPRLYAGFALKLKYVLN